MKETALWFGIAMMSAVLTFTGLLLIDTQKELEEAKRVAEEAIELATAPPALVELAVNTHTGDVLVRVDEAHIYSFEKACQSTRFL